MRGVLTMIRIPAAAAAAAILTGLIYLSVHPYSAVTRLGAVPFAVTLWAVFAGGAWLVRHIPGRWAVALILAGGIAVQLAALSAPPRSSDDLYRYIWDGRVQAAGIDPYQYVPAARQLLPLRDPLLWPGAPHAIWCVKPGTREAGAQLVSGCARINRPTVHTIYPPVAEAYFLGVHYLSPPGGRTIPIQAGAAFCAVALTLLLLYGLGRLGKDRRLAVLWAWCPLVALEAGNNAHVNVLAAGIAAAALMVLAKPGRLRRSLTGGALIGLAICTKVTPLLIGPAVLRRRRPVAVISAAAFATAVVYLPHVLAVGSGVIGFLPGYLQQEGYSDGTRFLLLGALLPGKWAIGAAFVILAVTALLVLVRGDPDRPWRGALLMTGVALAVTTPPFPWYTMLLVMLVAIDGRVEWLGFAMVKYLTVTSPVPGVTVNINTISRLGYALVFAFAVGISLARWVRGRRQAAAAPVPGAAPAPAVSAAPAPTVSAAPAPVAPAAPVFSSPVCTIRAVRSGPAVQIPAVPAPVVPVGSASAAPGAGPGRE